MPNRLSRIVSSAVLLAVGLLFLPSSAFAGFQWVSPGQATAPNAGMQAPAPLIIQAPPSPSVATGAPEAISPVIITGTSSASAPAPVSVPITSTTTTVTTTTPVTSPPAPLSGGETVRGFAKQVPLAVALRQILPPGYGFSIEPNVDLGVLISFQGGRPWRDTLRDALEPAGLAMKENGQMVTVGPAEMLAMPPQPTSLANATLTAMPAPRIVDVAPGIPAQINPPPTAQNTGPVVEQWQAQRGDNLRKTVEGWAKRANVEVNWMAEYDYPLQASFNYTGTFEDAVRNILTGFEDAHPQPVAELHSNATLGQRVLVVQTRGNNYSE